MPHLSVRHRDSLEHGCPSAALLDVVPHDPRSARVQAFSIYALMVGTLQLSRALVDQQLADVVLEQGHPERPHPARH